jgi:hypothetical protein
VTDHFMSRLAARALGQIRLAEPAISSRFDLDLVAAVEPSPGLAAKPHAIEFQSRPSGPQSVGIEPIAVVEGTPAPDGLESPSDGLFASAPAIVPTPPITLSRATSEARPKHRLKPALVARHTVDPLGPAIAPSHSPPAPSLTLASTAPLAAHKVRHSSTQQPATPEPVVHVTIGHVDVHAVAEPPSRKRAVEQRPPGPSLAEYLARRNRDERRR